MATNVFFRNYDNFNEQQLIDDLVIESIKMYGVDVLYVKRSIGSRDTVFNEDDTPIYDEVFEFESYVKNVDGFEGEGDFLSKFGLQIRDQVTFSVANRTFERFVTRENNDIVRPREGDLIFFPLNSKMYEIKNVEHESVFYQSGALQVFDIVCELIEYSNQIFRTGRDNVDAYFDDIITDTYTNVGANNASTLVGLANTDPIARNLFYEREGDSIIDFTEIDPFSEVIEIQDS
jgi:hypothetical protein